jgi:hypothetical protein
MTRPADPKGVGKGRVLRTRNSRIRSDDLTIFVEVRHSAGTGARVDRDHDYLLREFMEGSDE